MPKNTKRKAVLTEIQQQKLRTSIKDFLRWLPRHVVLARRDDYRFEFARPSRADWLMQVTQDHKGTVVTFNPVILAQCSYRYYEMVVLHECFHLFVHNVPNKDDAKRVKDDFGEVMMKMLDIEADYYTAMFLKEHQGATLVDIFRLMYEGRRVFADPHVRPTKLERFIGSILSIAAPYIDPKWRSSEVNLYLPTTTNLPTEDTIDIMITRKTNFVLSTIRATGDDFKQMKLCYTRADQYNVFGYIETLLQFVCKALDCYLPARIGRQLSALDHQQALFSEANEDGGQSGPASPVVVPMPPKPLPIAPEPRHEETP